MTINRRWLAHEWLYLLGGLVFAFLVLLFSGFLFGPVFTARAGRLIVVVVSYLLVRITIWALRTLREQK